jgi:hypothetical protein
MRLRSVVKFCFWDPKAHGVLPHITLLNLFAPQLSFIRPDLPNPASNGLLPPTLMGSFHLVSLNLVKREPNLASHRQCAMSPTNTGCGEAKTGYQKR